jgi:uncharacterized delta-60 repeat protein
MLFAASAAVPAQQPGVEGAATYLFTIDYSSDVPINTATLGNQNAVVTGPGGFSQAATFVSETTPGTTTLDATYSLTAPGNILSTTADGTYTVTMEPFNANAGTGVADIRGNAVPAGVAGTFNLQVSPAPVLELTNPVFTAGQYNPGGTLPFHATVTNDGHAAAAPFTLSVGLVPTLVVTNEVVQVLATASVSQSLAPGQSVVVNVPNATIPAGETPGAYTLTARINFNVTGAAHNSNDSFTSPTPIVVVAPTPTPTPVKIGALNPNFGIGGVVLQSTPLVTTNAIAVQSDGKTVAVGQVNAGNGTHDFGVTRFNADGSLDTTFGQTTSGGVTSPGTGTVTTDFGGGDDGPIAVSIQSDGKIVVAGTSFVAGNASQSSFALARYNADGSLDTSFGNGGLIVTSFSAAGSTSSNIA